MDLSQSTPELILNIINHPVYQRLRRIKQLGLTDLVYPGANHTRFHHAIGAMHLMNVALETLENKGHQISEQEHEAALIAILLHDIGHGPFFTCFRVWIIDQCNSRRDIVDFNAKTKSRI